MEVMKKVIKNIGLIFTILGLFYFTTACSFAKGIPNYNPKEPNPKPGLYYVGETKYFPGSAIVLKDGKVLIHTTKQHPRSVLGYEYIEIFDPRIGKVTNIVTLPSYIGITYLSNGNYQPDLLLSDGRVLLSAGLNRHAGFSHYNAEVYQIYNPVNNTITKVGTSAICRTHTRNKGKVEKAYLNHTPDKMYQLNSDKIAAYCYIGNDRNEMEIIDLKNNTISKPIKKEDPNYIAPPKVNLSNFNYTDFVNSFRKLYPEFDEHLSLGKYNIMNLSSYSLTENRYLVVSRSEVDYGITVDKVLNGRISSTWFSPLYEYNTETKKLIKKNEYLRSATGRIYHLKDTNKIIIFGGKIRDVFPSINQNADSSKISLIDRILYPDWMYKQTKKIYIYVY